MNYENLKDKELIPRESSENTLEKPNIGRNVFMLPGFEYVVNGFESIKSGISQLKTQNQSQYFDLKQDLEEIKDAVIKKPKKKSFSKPLREPATDTVFIFLINLPRGRHEHLVAYSRFRIAITILYFTGLRVNEIRNFTLEDINTLKYNSMMQIYQPKTNKYKKIYLPEFGFEMLELLQDDIDLVFSGGKTLGNGLTVFSWIRFINKRLVKHTDGLFENIRSHSFRVNFATGLLKKDVPLQKVSELIGHADIKTTLRYNRYKVTDEKHLTDKERLNLIDKAYKY